MLIFITFLISSLLKSFIDGFIFLGKKYIITSCDITSPPAFTRIMKLIACVKLCDKNLSINSVISISLATCSTKFESMYGNIFCFPQKYPFMIDEILMNGVTSERHIIGKYKVSFLRSVLRVGANNTVTTIIKIFIILW